MSSIPSTHTESQPHSVQQTSDQAQLRWLEQELAYYKTAYHHYKQQEAWQQRLFRNPIYSPSEKLTIWAGKLILENGTPNEQGLTHMPMYKIAGAIGMNEKTVGRNFLTLSEKTEDVKRHADPPKLDADTGQYKTDVYIAFSAMLLSRPDKTIRLTPRNQGGKRTPREHCHACGSEHLIDIKQRFCQACGCVLKKTVHPVAHPPSEQRTPQPTIQDTKASTHAPMDNLSCSQNQKEPPDNLSIGEKPTRAGGGGTASLLMPPILLSEPEPGQAGLQSAEPQQTERQFEQAAALLLDIAGDTHTHICMLGEQGRKYITRHSGLTQHTTLLHLEGRKTVGANLEHQDTTTRALCFESDDKPTDTVTWQELKEEAAFLVDRGYRPLLEPSPAGRGGHMWIIFTERVNARAAYQQLCEIAPRLSRIGEYWPGRGEGYNVRLPAGKYVSPEKTAWTRLEDATGRVLSENGIQAAAILLSHQTPASLIPEVSTSDDPVAQEMLPASSTRPALLPGRGAPEGARRYEQVSLGCRPRPLPSEPDDMHRQKYGEHKMWVAWPNEQYLIDRFNREHTIDELVERERSGMINATLIGRPEDTASVTITPDGKRFTDFGASARREDGSQDGGDPFEFYCRLHNLPKSEALQQLGRETSRSASNEILRSARSGELPSAETMTIISATGREVYNENALRFGQKTLEEHAGGELVGFSEPEIQHAGSEPKTSSIEAEQASQQQSLQVEITVQGVEEPVTKCHAASALNEQGQKAGAREKIVSYRECGSTRWIWSESERYYMCAECFMPRPKEG